MNNLFSFFKVYRKSFGGLVRFQMIRLQILTLTTTQRLLKTLQAVGESTLTSITSQEAKTPPLVIIHGKQLYFLENLNSKILFKTLIILYTIELLWGQPIKLIQVVQTFYHSLTLNLRSKWRILWVGRFASFSATWDTDWSQQSAATGSYRKPHSVVSQQRTPAVLSICTRTSDNKQYE